MWPRIKIGLGVIWIFWEYNTKPCLVAGADRLYLFLGSLLAADEAAGKDDTGHGKVCCTEGGHYHSVSSLNQHTM